MTIYPSDGGGYKSAKTNSDEAAGGEPMSQTPACHSSPPNHVPQFQPPKPLQRPHCVESPNGTRDDPYFWLRDDSRESPEVLAHLRAENTYADAMLAPVQPLIGQLYEEMVARLKQDDSSVPLRFRGYWYWSRFEAGGQYPIYMRRRDGAPESDAAILFDCNVLATGHSFFQLASYEVSPDNRLVAFAVDTVGRRQYQVRIKDLVTGELLPDVIENAEPDLAWTDDNRSLLYVEKDEVTLLGCRVRRHVLGSSEPDALVYEEPDDSFGIALERSKSQQYLFIGCESTTSSEWRYALANDPALKFSVLAPRAEDHEYQIDHFDDRFLIRTNWKAQNFRIASAPVADEGTQARPDRWTDVLAHDPQIFIQDFEVFRDFLAISERSGGLSKIRVRRWGERAELLHADDPAYTMHIGANPEIESTQLRYVYTSLTTPATTYEVDVRSGERRLLKREPVLGKFDPADYRSEFLWAPARDGERIPVSIVWHKDTPRDGTAPLFQYAYGSYGLSMDPAFSSSRLSLLDRGFIHATAHVRGGQEMGRRWYEAGRLLHKWNTFNDFIDVTDFLVAQRFVTAGRIYASGGSAGGLLVGAVINTAPEKYGGAVANVPFVDIVTTMLDESIPLTTLEYDEWGNPNEAEFYRYMLSYSPYDNVRTQAYPPMLVTTGLWDSQVQYYEPAKWVARLRDMRTDSNPVLFHTNLEAGHGGQSGRFERLREVAREYGFVIALASGGFSTASGVSR